jgi:hypothetical protein
MMKNAADSILARGGFYPERLAFSYSVYLRLRNNKTLTVIQ